MRATVYLSPATVREESVRGRTVVVLDVLRASSTIVTALEAGALGVIPAESIEAATEMVVKLGRDDTLLCAERDGFRVDGCDLGNSPREYTPEEVADRLIVLATTNGSRAIVRCRTAATLYVGAYLNAGRIVEALTGLEEVVIVCAGNEGGFSLEDAACAGHLLHRLEETTGEEVDPTGDGAWVALRLGRDTTNTPLDLLKRSSHGLRLASYGFGDDLPVCAEVDARPILPVLRDHIIVRST